MGVLPAALRRARLERNQAARQRHPLLRPRRHGHRLVRRSHRHEFHPAAIVDLAQDQFALAPVVLFMNAKYKDTGVSQSNRGVLHPYANAAVTFDPNTFSRLFGGETPVTVSPPDTNEGRLPHRSTYEITSSVAFVIVGHATTMPARAAVHARGFGARLRDLTLVARYAPGTPKEYSAVLATSAGPYTLSGTLSPIAAFDALANPLPDAPAELLLHGIIETGEADVRLLVDGRDIGGTRVSAGPVEQQETAQEPSWPQRETHELRPTEEPSLLKFGMGMFVQAGAGADFKIPTELFPEGVKNFSEFAFLSMTPTIGYKLLDFLSVGATLQINYSELSVEAPMTKPIDTLKGNLFPTGSLDASLNSTFGMPAAIGAATKYAFNTSSTHAPGTSITHTEKGNDVAFSEITGKAKFVKANALGLGGRFGLQAKITDRLTLGLTYQTKSAQENYRGRLEVDYTRQIDALVANPTYGHSNEVSGPLGIPSELRFTFDQIWNQGTVDLWTGGSLMLSNFALPSGSIKSNLPTGGANGFVTTYDMRIIDHQLPAEVGLGLSYRLTDDLAMLFDYKRVLWSEAMDALRFELRNGTNPDINAMVGSSDIDIAIPLEWKDQNVFAFGLESEALEWLTLRVGYTYAENPVPPETLLVFMPVIPEHHISAGWSIKLGTLRLDLAVMHVLENGVRITTSKHNRDLAGGELSVTQDFVSMGVTYDF
ncbi:MAG: outer membrane protein transport protein [Planctomycetes bacterium]|nr:outer membrane protein transport protein [Planctomycetota bacterium]